MALIGIPTLLMAPVDHRQSIDTRRVSSVIHALQSVGKTTTGVVVFLIVTAANIT